MASLFRSAILGVVLAAPLSLAAQASAPHDHDIKSARIVPFAKQDLRVDVRYARARETLSDVWYGGEEVERPRRAVRKAHRPRAAKPVRSVRMHTPRAVKPAAKPTVKAAAMRPARIARPAAPRREAAYMPAANLGSGIASYYWQGQRTASGAAFNPDGLTAAHRTLPFGTRVRVTHTGNGRSVDVVINDRGPFIGGRVIDLSRGAARVIGMTGSGLANVRMEVLGR